MSDQGEQKRQITIIDSEGSPSPPKKDWKAKAIDTVRALVSSMRDRGGAKPKNSSRSIIAYRPPAFTGELSEAEGFSQETYHKYSSKIAHAVEKIDDLTVLLQYFENPEPALDDLFFSDGGVAGADKLKLTGVLKKLTFDRIRGMEDKNAFDVGIACEVFMLEKFGIQRMGHGPEALFDSEYEEVVKKATQMYEERGFGRFSSDFGYAALERISQSRYTNLIIQRGVTEDNSKEQTARRLEELAEEVIQREIALVKWDNRYSEDYRSQLEDKTKKIIEKMQKMGFSDQYIRGDDIRARLNDAALSLK